VLAIRTRPLVPALCTTASEALLEDVGVRPLAIATVTTIRDNSAGRKRIGIGGCHMVGLQRALAALGIVLTASRTMVASSISLTVGLVLGLLLTPLWLPTVSRFRGVPVIMFAGAAAVVCGAILTALHTADHLFSAKLLVANSVLLLSILVGMGVFLWARTVIPSGVIAMLFAAGLLLRISPGEGQFSNNPWKFGFSLPATVMLLGLAALLRRRWLELFVVATLATVSGLNDSRSSAAITLLAGLFIAWQIPPRPSSRRRSAMLTLAGLGVLAAVVYHLGESLILNGALGDTTQQRSAAQVDASGSLILGGRPEIAATWALLIEDPMGFGSGLNPSHADLNIAKAGMASINYDPNNGYVERYMFGTGYEVHSIMGDLWINFGIAGLGFALVVLVISLMELGRGIASRRASGIVLFLTVTLLWNMFFSPFYSSIPLTILLLGLLLSERHGTEMASAGQRSVELGATLAGAPVRHRRTTGIGADGGPR
jgi:hypothetical protein